jgi:signal transduction histidine kinase/DNA-binding response OmpR family regulator
MRALRRMSIRNKLIAIVLLATIAPLVCGFAVVVWNERRAFRQEMLDNAVVIARVTAENAVPDLAFGDREAAGKTLSKLASIPSAERAFLFDSDGHLFAAWYRSGHATQPPAVGDGARLWSGAHLDVGEPVAFKSERYGRIVLEMTTAGLREKLRGHLLTLVFLTASVIAAALLLAVRLEKIVSTPVLSLAALAREISENHDYSVRARRTSDDEIGTLADGFNEMLTQIERRQRERDEADQRTREKSQFLANMSHELRTPLNAIIGFSEILRGRLAGRAGERELKFLDNINSSGQHLLGIVNDILDLSKIEAGKMEIAPERFAVVHAVDAVCTLMRGVSGQRRIHLDVDVPPDLPLLEADPVKVKQILYNLVSNAVKFSPEGSVVRIVVRASDDAIRMSVIDYGVGIDPQDHARVFLEFQQVDSRISRQFGGTGLGLTLVRKFVDMHGGTVELESALGAGSTFTVTLPLRFRGSMPPRAAAGESSGRRPRVLVIEDETASFDGIAALLRAAGYEPHHAHNGDEGLRLARELAPAAITLDLILPGVDGIEVLKRLKADPLTRAIPVIIVSMTNNRELAVAFGASDYFVKPFDCEALAASLRRHIHGNGATLLVVDDDCKLHDLLASPLREHGYSLLHARGASEGFARAASELPSVVILDLMMRENGFELAAQLRSDPRTARLPIVAVAESELSRGDRQRLVGNMNALLHHGELAGAQLVPLIRDLIRTEAEA